MEREYQLPYRQARENVIDEMRGGCDHASGGAGGADATAFAGVSNQEVVASVGTAGASEAVGENAAFEVTAEFVLGQYRGMTATAVVVQRQLGGEVVLQHALEKRAVGLAPVVNGRRTARFGGSGKHGQLFIRYRRAQGRQFIKLVSAKKDAKS